MVGTCHPFMFAESVDSNILKRNTMKASFAEIVGHFFLEREGALVLTHYRRAVLLMR